MQATGRILVVDDEDSVRVGLYQTLAAEGYQVTTSANGKDALQQMSQQGAEVVLLDIMMPGISGLEVLQKLLTDYPDTVVIMVTAVGDISTATNAIRDGAYDYVIKPFALEDVIQSVKRAREKRRLTLAERQHQQELEKMREHQKSALEEQFKQLVQALAREHATVLRAQTSRKSKTADITSLPVELQKPKASIEDFAKALLEVMERGGLTSR